MSTQNSDPLWHIAEQVADCFSERGYAFVEEDKLETLAAALRSFLTVAGIPVNTARTTGTASTVADQPSPPGRPGSTPARRSPAASTVSP